jgi:hypothetical protein
MRTLTMRPTGSWSSASKCTISLRSLRPVQAPRLFCPSTSTSSSLPTRRIRCAFFSPCDSSNKRAKRSIFSASGTSSGSRNAGVNGRGEYLKPYRFENSTSRTSASVCSKSSGVSPGKPTMASVDKVTPGTAACSASTRSRNSATL